mgnify:CR=1 FL=1
MLKTIIITFTVVIISSPAFANSQCSCVCMNGQPVEVCPQGVPGWGAACYGVFNCF